MPIAYPLSKCPLGAELVINRIASDTPSFLKFAESRRLIPSTPITVNARDNDADSVTIMHRDGAEVTIGLSASEKIFVK